MVTGDLRPPTLRLVEGEGLRELKRAGVKATGEDRCGQMYEDNGAELKDD